MTEQLKKPELPPSETQELGNFRDHYPSRSLPGKVLLGTTIFCFCFSLIEVALGIEQYLRPPSKILSDSFRQDRIMISFVLVGVFFLIALANATLFYVHKKHSVDLYVSGIVITTWKGSQIFAWEDIMELTKMPIFGYSRRAVNYTYSILGYDDRKVKFRGLVDLSRLGSIVEYQVEKQLGS
jgi:hypothetical protein